jgi:cytochrome c
MDSMTVNKILAAVLLAGVVAMTSGFVTRLIHPAAGGGHHGAAHGEVDPMYAAYMKADDGHGAGKPEAPAGPEPIAGLLAAADLEAGKKVFKKCTSCHSADKGAPNKVGPGLYGIVGNDIASVGGFSYSGAMAGLPGNWTYADLNKFLFKPKTYVKGTKMAFAGLKRAKDRAALIAYLRAQDDAPESLPIQ